MENLYQFTQGLAVSPTLVLAKPNGEKRGALYYKDPPVSKVSLTNADELTVTVYKYADDNNPTPYWDEIVDMMLLFVPETNKWYQISVNLAESTNTTKAIEATALCESELSQRMLYEVEINTEDDIARTDYVVTFFYDKTNPKGSLLNRLLADKAPDYTIGYVSPSLVDSKIFRQFSFDGKSIKDCLDEIAEELNVLFVYGENKYSDENPPRVISAYDMLDYCRDCGNRDDFSDNNSCTKCSSTNYVKGYGKDSGVLISAENVASSLECDSQLDSLKTCFRLTGGDDDMTAAIRLANPSGSNYMWAIPETLKSLMSNGLRQKLKDYDKKYKLYHDSYDFGSLDEIKKYNALYNKYKDYLKDLAVFPESTIKGYDSLVRFYYSAYNLSDQLKDTMMPARTTVEDLTAAEEWDKIEAQIVKNNIITVALPSKATTVSVQDAVETLVNIYLDKEVFYADVSVNSDNSSVAINIVRIEKIYDNGTQKDETFFVSNIKVVQDSSSTAYEKYLKNEILAAQKDVDSADFSLYNIFDSTNFNNLLKRYCLDSLQMIAKMCQSAIDVMIAKNAQNDDDTKVLYNNYRTKYTAIQNEISTRTKEVESLKNDGKTGICDAIMRKMNAANSVLNFQNYLGDVYWTELQAYRREDEYKNDNFISDGLNTGELFDRAQQFFDNARKEIKKAATPQYTLQGQMNNFLALPEFKNFAKNIDIGNYIRVKVDDTIYKLRLLSYTIDYSSPASLQLTFSNALRKGDAIQNVQKILASASSMATSYDFTERQADKSVSTGKVVSGFVNDGLKMTGQQLVSSTNEEVVHDQRGIWIRRTKPYSNDSYEDEQVKILSNGLYYTTDNWNTVKSAVGHFKYKDPSNNFEEKDGYGVIADTIVGDLILGDNIGIYSSDSSGSFVMNGDKLEVRGESGSTFTIYLKDEKSGGYRAGDVAMSYNGRDISFINGTTMSGKNQSGIFLSNGDADDEIKMIRIDNENQLIIMSHIYGENQQDELDFSQKGIGIYSQNGGSPIGGSFITDNGTVRLHIRDTKGEATLDSDRLFIKAKHRISMISFMEGSGIPYMTSGAFLADGKNIVCTKLTNKIEAGTDVTITQNNSFATQQFASFNFAVSFTGQNASGKYAMIKNLGWASFGFEDTESKDIPLLAYQSAGSGIHNCWYRTGEDTIYMDSPQNGKEYKIFGVFALNGLPEEGYMYTNT